MGNYLALQALYKKKKNVTKLNNMSELKKLYEIS